MKMKLISRDETYPFEIDSYVTEYDIDFATNPDSLARDYEVANKMKATLVVPKSNYKDENVQTLLSWSDEPYNSEHYYRDIALNLQAAGNNERTLVFTHAALKASVSGVTRGDKVTITLNIIQKKDKMVGVLFGEDVDTTYDQALWRVMHPPRVGIVPSSINESADLNLDVIVEEKEYVNIGSVSPVIIAYIMKENAGDFSMAYDNARKAVKIWQKSSNTYYFFRGPSILDKMIIDSEVLCRAFGITDTATKNKLKHKASLPPTDPSSGHTFEIVNHAALAFALSQYNSKVKLYSEIFRLTSSTKDYRFTSATNRKDSGLIAQLDYYANTVYKNEDSTGVYTDSYSTKIASLTNVERIHDFEGQQRMPSNFIVNTYKDHVVNNANAKGYDPKLIFAIMLHESLGNGYVDGRLFIRFELHYFLHIQNGGSPGGTGLARSSPLNGGEFLLSNPDSLAYGQQWKKPGTTNYIPLHPDGSWKDNDLQWEVFERAKQINSRAAYYSISFGLPQLMGVNHDDCGYSSPQALFDAVNDGGNIAHINVLFSRIDRAPNLQAAFKECNRTNLETIARIYNGPGRVQGYADDIQNAYDKITL